MIGEEGSPLRRFGNVNFGPLAAAYALSLIGLLTINSASAELSAEYLPRQALWVVVGTVALVAVAIFDYHKIVALAPALYATGIAFLILVLVVGRYAGGARRWLSIGPVSFQPSEFAKLATILLLTRYLSTVYRPHLRWKEIGVAVAIVALPMVLILLERDLGGALTYCPIAAGMLLVAGIRWRELAVGLLLGLVLSVGLWSYGMRDYQKARVVSFLAPEKDPLGAGYQLRQSKIAIGSGQAFGRGYQQGPQSQLRFLPERHTDFIISVLAEEWGFAGIVTVLGAYSFLLWTGTGIALRSRDRSALLLAAGILSMYTFHTLYNLSMVVGLLPITGIPMPFLSYGGSFTLINFLACGLLLNIDFRRYVNR